MKTVAQLLREDVEHLIEFVDQTSQIDNLVQHVADYVKGGNTDRSTCVNLIYSLLTKDDKRGQTFVQNWQTNPNFVQWRNWYQSYKDILGEYAQTIGWLYQESSGWSHYTRKGTEADTEHRKLYVSIDPHTLGTELPKVSALMRNLDAAVPKQYRVSVKLPGNFGMIYAHRDTIVIHFPAAQFSQAVQQAVRQAGLTTLDRSQFARTDFGQDATGEGGKHTSDSQLVAERVMPSIDASKPQVQQMTPDQLKTALLTLVRKASMAPRA